MQQIADWLEKLNLGQYAQRFAENDIDVSVLRHLTDADLEKIGVSLGHRRKILAAIAELSGASPSKHEPADGVEPKPQRNRRTLPSHRYVFRPMPASQFASFFSHTLLSWKAAPPNGATGSAPVSVLMPRPSG